MQWRLRTNLSLSYYVKNWLSLEKVYKNNNLNFNALQLMRKLNQICKTSISSKPVNSCTVGNEHCCWTFFIQKFWKVWFFDELGDDIVEETRQITLANKEKKRTNNSCLFCFYILYCIRLWPPFLLELDSFCKKLFWSSKNRRI